jgi:hypothetical protein
MHLDKPCSERSFLYHGRVEVLRWGRWAPHVKVNPDDVRAHTPPPHVARHGHAAITLPLHLTTVAPLFPQAVAALSGQMTWARCL